MSPWLLVPQSTMGRLPTHSDLTCLPVETRRMLWPVFIIVVVILSVVMRMASRTGPRVGKVNGGSEMEKVEIKEAEDEKVISGRGSSNVVV